MIRIYQDVVLKAETTVTLTEKASHHLKNVLRATVGDNVVIFNNTDGDFKAQVTAIQKKHIEVYLNQLQQAVVYPQRRIILAQGISRSEKMDLIVQKCVELGVSEIVPLITARCNFHKIAEKRLRHWQEVIISACEQSGRNDFVKLHPITSFATLLSTHYADDIGVSAKKFILTPAIGETLTQQKEVQDWGLEKISPRITILIVIGPEGGFTASEVELAYKQGFTPIVLGPRILRTETAAIVATALMQYCFGDLR